MNRIINRSQGPARAGLTVLALALLALGGCSGTGTLTTAGSGGGIASGDGLSGTSSPLAAVVQEQGNTVTDVGQGVSSLSRTVAAVATPLVGSASAQGVNGVVAHAGGAVSAAGAAVANGIGQIGNLDNPLGRTAADLGHAVDQTGLAVSSAGDAVTGLGQNAAMSALRPVTNAAGQAVDQTGSVVSRVGQVWESRMDTGPAGQALNGASNVVQTVVNAGVGATQTVGSATGLGAPVANQIIDPLAQALGQAGGRLSGSELPVAREVGDVLGNTTRALGHTGDMVSAPPSGGSPGPVEQVGRSLNTAIVPITGAVTQVASRANDTTELGTLVGNLVLGTGGVVQQLGSGVQGNGTQPVANSLGGVVNQTGGLVANVGVALGGTGTGTTLLAPVVNTVGALTGGITTTVGNGGGSSTPLTTTLTNTVGGITGGITGALRR